MERKAQVFGGEFLASYLLFLTCLVMLLYLWNTNLLEIGIAEKQQDMNNLGVDVAEQLFRTPGYPSNWTAQNVTVIGLANESRVILPQKVQDFVLLMSTANTSLCSNSTNYECKKYLLGTMKYEFSFNLTYINDTTIKINNTECFTGKRPVNETRLITVVRTGVMEGEVVKLYFTIWTK